MKHFNICLIIFTFEALSQFVQPLPSLKGRLNYLLLVLITLCSGHANTVKAPQMICSPVLLQMLFSIFNTKLLNKPPVNHSYRKFSFWWLFPHCWSPQTHFLSDAVPQTQGTGPTLLSAHLTHWGMIRLLPDCLMQCVEYFELNSNVLLLSTSSSFLCQTHSVDNIECKHFTAWSFFPYPFFNF